MHSLQRGFEFLNLKSAFQNLKSPGSFTPADFRSLNDHMKLGIIYDIKLGAQ